MREAIRHIWVVERFDKTTGTYYPISFTYTKNEANSGRSFYDNLFDCKCRIVKYTPEKQ